MKVLATWDDGPAEDMRLADLMAKYEIPTIFYVPVMWEQVQSVKDRSFLTKEQFKQLASQFEIGGHTVVHPHLTKIHLDAADFEIRGGRELMQEMTGQEIRSFCYPRGYSNEAVRNIVRLAGYTDARTTAVGSITAAEDPYQTPTTVHIGIDRAEYNGQSWFNYAIQKLHEATDLEDSVFHMWGHGWEIEQHNGWQGLEILLREIQGLGHDLETVRS